MPIRLKPIATGEAMNHRDADAFRLFTREWHERRVREADVERLAREIRASGRRRIAVDGSTSFRLASSPPPATRRLET
jgi:hypothetical protein